MNVFRVEFVESLYAGGIAMRGAHDVPTMLLRIAGTARKNTRLFYHSHRTANDGGQSFALSVGEPAPSLLGIYDMVIICNCYE